MVKVHTTEQMRYSGYAVSPGCAASAACAFTHPDMRLQMEVLLISLLRSLNKKHSWCCGTPEPRKFVTRCRHWNLRKHTNLICRCRESNKYFHLLPWKRRRNQHAKFGEFEINCLAYKSERQKFCNRTSLGNNDYPKNQEYCRAKTLRHSL